MNPSFELAPADINFDYSLYVSDRVRFILYRFLKPKYKVKASRGNLL